MLSNSLGPTDTSKVQLGREVRTNKGSNAPPSIPKEFKKWKHLFKEEIGLAALPKYKL